MNNLAYNEAQKKAVAKYNAKAYDELKIRVLKGKKQDIQDFARDKGKSLNEFVNTAIDEKIERDK